MPEEPVIKESRTHTFSGVMLALKQRVEALEKDNLRLFDLVRYDRHSLFNANLITPGEFNGLLVDERAGESVKRLGNYDQMQTRIRELEATGITALSDRVKALEEAIHSMPEFPKRCTHDEEPDYCALCGTIYDEAILAWMTKLTAVVQEKQ